jgi:hypothetical protein
MMPVSSAVNARAPTVVANSTSVDVPSGELAMMSVAINANTGAVSSSGNATTGRAALNRLKSEPATTAVEMSMVIPDEIYGVSSP